MTIKLPLMSLTHQLTQSTCESILTGRDLESRQTLTPGARYATFGPESLEWGSIAPGEEIPESFSGAVTWIHWTGLANPEDLSKVFARFHIHPLIAEDILNVESRAKLEESGKGIFIVLKMPIEMDAIGEIESEHFCLYYIDGLIISFSESPLHFLSDLERRLQEPSRRIRNYGSDYTMWAILDLVADHNIRFADFLNDRVEEIEDQLIEEQDDISLSLVHEMKNEVSQTYRIVRPLRDITTHLKLNDSSFLTERVQPYFFDLHDHAVQTVELLEHLRDKAASLRELYYTSMSHRMNEVMKVLTSLSAIFLPLTFLAGLYGMNFVFMPELSWRWSYPAFLVVLASLATVLIIYFKRKNWL